MSVLGTTPEAPSDMAIKVPPPRAATKLILSVVQCRYLSGKNTVEARVIELCFGQTDRMEFG
jgi:hypothetical protein